MFVCRVSGVYSKKRGAVGVEETDAPVEKKSKEEKKEEKQLKVNLFMSFADLPLCSSRKSLQSLIVYWLLLCDLEPNISDVILERVPVVLKTNNI